MPIFLGSIVFKSQTDNGDEGKTCFKGAEVKQISCSSHPDGVRRSWAGLVLVWILGVWDWRDKATLSACVRTQGGEGEIWLFFFFFSRYRLWVIPGLVLNFSACSDWLWFCLFGVQHSMKIPRITPGSLIPTAARTQKSLAVFFGRRKHGLEHAAHLLLPTLAELYFLALVLFSL